MPVKQRVHPFRLHYAITGTELVASIEATEASRPVLIESLALEETSLMISSPPGQGKSAIMLTAVAQSSVPLPVFNELPCPRALRSYVFCPERSARELKERMKSIRKAVDYNPENIAFDDGMTGIVDIGNQFSRDQIALEIERVMPKGIDIFYVEGMYAMTRKPLASEEAAQEFYRFGAELFGRFGPICIWYSNHTRKAQTNYKGEELPLVFFGSQLLLANVTGAYIFERIGNKQSKLKQFKDTVSGLADELIFDFDAETFTTSLNTSSTLITGREKVRIFVNSCHRDGKTFNYDQLAFVSNLQHSTLERIILREVAEKRIINLKPKGAKALYQALAPI